MVITYCIGAIIYSQPASVSAMILLGKASSAERKQERHIAPMRQQRLQLLPERIGVQRHMNQSSARSLRIGNLHHVPLSSQVDSIIN